LDDLDLGLSDTDRFDQHHVAADGVKHPQRLRRSGSEATQMPAGRHGPDEHPRVGGVILHPYPIAEQSAAGERRGRIDSEHADPFAGLTQPGDHRRG